MNIEIIDYFAKWCGPCNQYSPILDKFSLDHPEVKVTKVDIEADENYNVVEELGIKSIPTTIIKVDGEIKFRRSGVMTVSDLEFEINELKSNN